MPLIPVFFMRPDETFFKAMVPEEEKEFFLTMGAQETPEIMKIPDPDKGWGKPGTLEFYKNTLKSFNSKKEVADFIFELTSKPMPKITGSLVDHKKKAFSLVKEFLNDNQSK